MKFKLFGRTIIDDTPFCGPVCECKRRCKGWFGALPEVERQCKNACSSNKHITREEFLCSGNWIEDIIIIQAYGYDPCPDSGSTLEEFLDPLNDRERQEKELEQYTPVLIGGAALLLIVIIVFVAIAVK